MEPCKFALKVWNAQQAGAIGVSHARHIGITKERPSSTAPVA